jgi:hypothetical protein
MDDGSDRVRKNIWAWVRANSLKGWIVQDLSKGGSCKIFQSVDHARFLKGWIMQDLSKGGSRKISDLPSLYPLAR